MAGLKEHTNSYTYAHSFPLFVLAKINFLG